ncbi:CxC5 domain-containing protein [Mycena sanguinolenta]|uniref:CxC5 domain-containing protein n=1 Tax=Mycena sanguinolenta TaxID=230812 RepID=A0A8H6XTT6_9AGAR|nr:CxC5 domain-containing protein [Mycena sanguinolenta]
MSPTVRDLILVLQFFFPGDLDLRQALYLFGIIFSVYPLLRLHLNQRRQPGQRTQRAWFNTIRSLFRNALKQEDGAASIWGTGNDRSAEYAEYLSNDLGALYQLLGLDPHSLENPDPDPIFPAQRIVLCTTHLSCIVCPPGDLNITPHFTPPYQATGGLDP